MNFPATSNELRAAGYEYDNESTCRGCGETIEWWITPKGNKMPMSVQRKSADVLHSSEEVRVSHFQTCPKAGDFRRKA